jgi:hypothetical protein
VVFWLYLHIHSALCNFLSSWSVVCDANGFSLFMVYLMTVPAAQIMWLQMMELLVFSW